MTMAIDYVRWMGIAAWTCGLAIPRRSLGVSLIPGNSPRHVSIQCAGGCAHTLEVIEREYTGIQWLLGGSPYDESALDYVQHQELCMTKPDLMDRTFAVVDFSDATPDQDGNPHQGHDYSPEASLAAARQLSTTQVGTTQIGAELSKHIPSWNLAEPLGLLALAVREFLTGSAVRRLTHAYAHRSSGKYRHPGNPPGSRLGDHTEDHAGSSLAYARLAYSVAYHHEPAIQSTKPLAAGSEPTAGSTSRTAPFITVHVLADDPIFTAEALKHLIDRAQDFAVAFGSTINCHAIFHDIHVHSVFPATIHEPDAHDTPILLYKIPLAADLLPEASFPPVFRDGTETPRGSAPCDSVPYGSATPHKNTMSTQNALARMPVVLHRDSHSGVIVARPFTPGRTILDRSIQWGGYLTPADVISTLHREYSTANPSSLAASATPAMIWESLATWGLCIDTTTNAVNPPVAPGATAVLRVRPHIVSRVGNSINKPLIMVEVDATAPFGSVIHDVCDVLDSLGVEPPMDFPIELVWSSKTSIPYGTDNENNSAISPKALSRQRHSGTLPCLWPRALGAQRYAITDQALALALVRHSLRGYSPQGVSWVGVRSSPGISLSNGKPCISVAIASTSDEGKFTALASALSSAINTACAKNFPDSQVVCSIVDANSLSRVRDWITACGYHPVFGFLPAYIQLERLSENKFSAG